MFDLSNTDQMAELNTDLYRLGFTADSTPLLGHDAASAYQPGCFFDALTTRVYFNAKLDSAGQRGQGFCAWKFPSSVHYIVRSSPSPPTLPHFACAHRLAHTVTSHLHNVVSSRNSYTYALIKQIAHDDRRTCLEMGDFLITTEVECLQAAVSENPSFSGSYEVFVTGQVNPAGCSIGAYNQVQFNPDLSSGRGIEVSHCSLFLSLSLCSFLSSFLSHTTLLLLSPL